MNLKKKKNRLAGSLSAAGIKEKVMTVKVSLLISLLIFSLTPGAPTFTSAPAITDNPSGGYWVEFGISENTDVEVSIVDTVSKTVVRHITAGLLGSNAPAPLAKDALTQKLAWDGTDDFGNAIPDMTRLRARVRAGLGVSINAYLGENNYAFYRKLRGIALGNDGKLHVFGSFPWLAHHGTACMALRRYNPLGVYDKTLWPVPAGLDRSTLGPLQVYPLPDNKYMLTTEASEVPQFGGTPLTYENSFLASRLVNGKVMVLEYPTLHYMLINADGSAEPENQLVKSPALTASGLSKITGPMYVTPSPDGSYYLLSGVYQADSNLSLRAYFPSMTGFWREGQVFKVDAATGAAAQFINIPVDSLDKDMAARRADVGPLGSTFLGYMAALMGTCFDDSGRIYVCDRQRDEVGIYSESGAKLGALPIADPDQVAVNTKTGAVYVLTRRFSYTFSNQYPPSGGGGVMKLYKFDNWQAGGSSLLSLAKGKAVSKVLDITKVAGQTYGRLNMVMDNSGAKSVLWLNGTGNSNFCRDSAITNVRGYRDDGDSLAVIRDFLTLNRNAVQGFDRMVVDRKTEQVYVQDSWYGVYKIEDWQNPVFVRCSTSAGKTLNAADLTLSPDGFLYVREKGYPGGPLVRYTQDHLHAPANFGSSGSNQVAPSIKHGFGGGTQDRGIAVSKDGDIYVYNGSYSKAVLQQYDTTGTLVKDTVVNFLGGSKACQSGGVKVDLAGNLYLSALFQSPTHSIPTAYSAYWPWVRSTGSVIKFDPAAGGQFTNTSQSMPTSRGVTGALKVYDIPVSPFGGNDQSAYMVPGSGFKCVCRTPRFDVDPYGRIYGTHTVAGQVSVADNAGNVLLSFGEYGNVDSRGPDVAMIWPTGIAATDKFLYVNDLVNGRLLRLNMAYELTNLPIGVQKPVEEVVPEKVTFSSHPEPFNPVSRISLGLPWKAHVRLDVLDANGRLIRRLKDERMNPGNYRFNWNAQDERGRVAAAGVYIYRLRVGNRVVVRKTLFLP